MASMGDEDPIADEESGDETEVPMEMEEPGKYQKTFSTLKLLPYADILDDETDEYFERILRNLSKTILCADFQIGLLTYTRSLKGYIHLYGLKFTKQHHIKLVHLYYEIMTMESCPLSLIYDFADMYNTLLKKVILLKREDITIPWRPLFKTLDRCVHHRKYTLSASISLKLERVIREAIRHSNVYFESNMLQDVIDEFQPYLCPSSPKMVHGLRMLNMFLPFLSEDDEAQINKYLAFLLEFGKVWNNGPTWDWTLMNILGKAAWNMHGSFDWTPYLPLVYSRLLKGLELPVYFKNAKNVLSTESAKHFDFRAAASWIVATLGNSPEAMYNLKNFLETAETYFNPLNQGRWSLPLLSLLNELVSLFTIRLKRERYENNGKRWWQRFKPERMLTDEDVEEFVKITSEVVLDFFLDLQSSGFLLKHLAYIRPDIIIPAVLEKYESMVETLTEPRKYLIALRWVTVIIVPMASCRKEEDGFEGRKFMIPFAMSLLPAIDPNDMLKTMSALGILHCIFSVVPFVDCSSLSTEIEDEELKELAIATGCLEDFSLQFIDRIISLIENRTHENTRMADSRITAGQAINAEDSGLEKFVWAVFHRLASHSSTKILKAMAKKLTTYALSTTLETDVSGRLFASILQAYTVVRPDVMLPKLLPRLCGSIQEAITDDILDDEELEKTLQFHLQVLSFICETNGSELLKYKDDIETTISAILKLNGKRGYELASSTILRLLNSVVMTYPLENRISQSDFDDPKYLAIEDWGLTMEAKQVVCKWHIPTSEELEWAKSIFLKVYTEFSAHINQSGALSQKNEGLNKRLLKIIQVLQCALEGVQTTIPFWDDVPIKSEETVMELHAVRMEFGVPTLDILDPVTNENIKKSYFDMYSKIKTYLDNFKSDDTEAYVAVIRGLDNLIIPNFEPDRRMVLPLKSNHATNLNNSLKPKKKFTRATQIARAFESHLKRVRTASCTTWTTSHHEIMTKLFELCVNRYAKVRIFAQGRFCRIIDAFSSVISRGLSTLFIEKLQPGVSHDEYKGTLYTLLTCKVSPTIVNSWEEISMLWLALLRSPFSEKNSIIKCMDAIRKVLSQSFVFFPIQDQASPDLQKLAQALVLPETLSSFGELKYLKCRDLNESIFNNLLSELITSVSEGNNHWRQKILCANMLSVLITENMILPKKMVEYFFDSLIAKSPEIRSNALTTLNWLLALFKRKYPFVTVDTRTGFTFAKGESIHSVLQYKSDPGKDASLNGNFVATDLNGHTVPRLRIHKPYFGFTPLPLRVDIKQPPNSFTDLTGEPKQPQPVQTVIEVTRSYMENPEYLKNLLAVWTQEDRAKGLTVKRTQILKCVARNNGPEGLKLFLTMVPELGKDKDQWKQRCAADVLSGILHGIKSWSEESIAELWTVLEPILHDSLDNVTQETMKYWSSAMVIPNTNRDPNKLRFFIEFMKKRFIRSLETAHTTSVDAFKNMSFFDCVITSMHWRGGDIFPEILNLVQVHILDNPIPYVTVRDQLGRLLGDVFEWAVESPLKLECEVAPKYEPFVESVFDALKNLVTEASKYQANVGDTEENAEARNLLLKFKSTVEWLIAASWDMETTVPPILYRFIPLLCHFESYDPDPEVAQLVTVALSGLSRTLLLPEQVDSLVTQLQTASKSTSWRARLCVVEFLKVLALNNTNIFASNEEFSGKIIQLVLALLSDRKIEVRALASSVLSGLLHCLIVQKPMEMLSTFQKGARKFAVRRQKGLQATPKVIMSPEDIDAAHSTILGLCSFVEAHPYDCPEFLPEVLVTLTTHLHDPEPIPSTLRKCLLNFRRTHHDNWSVHKTKFSEDQLCILTDIFVSPCYYA